MARLITEHATFMVLDSECESRFRIHVNGQGDVTIKCTENDTELEIETIELKLIYDAVCSVYLKEVS